MGNALLLRRTIQQDVFAKSMRDGCVSAARKRIEAGDKRVAYPLMDGTLAVATIERIVTTTELGGTEVRYAFAKIGDEAYAIFLDANAPKTRTEKNLTVTLAGAVGIAMRA